MDTNDLLFFFLMTSFCDHIKGKCMICKGLLCLYSSQVSCLFGGLPRKVTVMSLPYDKLTFYFHLRTSSFSNFHLSRGLRLRLACNSLILSFHVVNSSNIGFIFISSHGNCHLLAVWFRSKSALRFSLLFGLLCWTVLALLSNLVIGMVHLVTGFAIPLVIDNTNCFLMNSLKSHMECGCRWRSLIIFWEKKLCMTIYSHPECPYRTFSLCVFPQLSLSTHQGVSFQMLASPKWGAGKGWGRR